MVLQVSCLNVHFFCAEEVRADLPLVDRLLAKVEKEHVDFDHPLHVDVHEGGGRLLDLVGAAYAPLRNRLVLKQSDFLAHLFLN